MKKSTTEEAEAHAVRDSHPPQVTLTKLPTEGCGECKEESESEPQTWKWK